MDYQKTIDWLFNQLPMYQRSGAAAYKSDIGNIIEACQLLNNPHQQFKSIHIAGTNGKGSTAHMLASIFQEAGYKTGLYTSPHLKDFRERIRINGERIPKAEVSLFVSKHRKWFSEIGMSFFEMTVALAFHYFAKEQVDIAIIETGLGGRLDSTNILSPELCIITNIGYDHTALLGGTLPEIAQEKAGIIKANTPVIIGRKQAEIAHLFEEKARFKNASIHHPKPCSFSADLKGNYQQENIATCVCAIQELQKMDWNISEQHIQKGLLNTITNTGLLGRWQILNKHPLTICDTAHNEDGIRNILQQLQETNYKQLHIVLGMVNDKNIEKILSLLPKEGIYYFCQAGIPRSLNKEELRLAARKHDLHGVCYTSVLEALKAANRAANKNDVIFIGGSTFVVAEVV
jgi:dihydrofolate synthase/folylpolyglutamate synthase